MVLAFLENSFYFTIVDRMSELLGLDMKVRLDLREACDYRPQGHAALKRAPSVKPPALPVAADCWPERLPAPFLPQGFSFPVKAAPALAYPGDIRVAQAWQYLLTQP